MKTEKNVIREEVNCIPIDQPVIIDSSKAQEFFSQKPNQDAIDKIMERAAMIDKIMIQNKTLTLKKKNY